MSVAQGAGEIDKAANAQVAEAVEALNRWGEITAVPDFYLKGGVERSVGGPRGAISASKRALGVGVRH